MQANRTVVTTILVLIGLLLSATARLVAEELPSQPNILFIFGDDWGYGDLGVHGHEELATPNLDRLASQGTDFRQFYVTSGVCSPSRCSVITGHYPARHGVHGHFAGNDKNAERDMPNWLDSAVESLPRILQQSGYKTAHYGKWHLGGGGLPHGDLSAPEPREYGYDDTRVWNGNGPTWNGTQLWPTTRYMDDDWQWVPNSSKLAVDATIKFVTEHRDGPFFVNLWLKDPHTPLKPTPEQREPYGQFDEPKQTYYAVLHDADYHVGRLLDTLDALGLNENTLVMFTSDNGPENSRESMGTAGITAGLRDRKRSLYEGGVRVPFLVRWPGVVPVGKVDTTSVLSTVDLMPTLTHIAGTEVPANYRPDGLDMTDAIRGNAFSRTKPLYWEWRSASPNPNSKACPGLSIREGDWKLLMNPSRNRIELYNIPADSAEQNNLAETQPELVDRLTKKLLAWKATLP